MIRSPLPSICTALVGLLLVSVAFGQPGTSGRPGSADREAVRKKVEDLNKRAYDIRSDSIMMTIHLAREAVALALGIGDSTGLALAYSRLGMGYKRTGEPDSAVYVAEKALGIAQRNRDRVGIMTSALLLAEVDRDQGRLENALSVGQLGLEVSQLLKDREREGMFYNSIGTTYMKMGDTRNATDAMYKGLEIRKSLGTPKDIMESRLNIANMYFEINQPDKAKVQYQEYIATARESGSKALLAKGLNNYGGALVKKEDYIAAYPYLDSALALYQEVKDDRNMAKTLHNLGIAARMLGRDDQAERFAQQALVAFGRIGSAEGLASSMLSLARAKEKRNDIMGAIALADSSLAKARQSKLLGLEADAHELLAELYKKHKEYDRAINEYKIFIVLKDSMINDKVVTELAASEMKERFNAEKNLAEIQDLKNKGIVDQARKQRSDLQRNGFIILSLMLLLLSVVLYRNLQHRKRLAKQEHALYEQRINDLMRQQEIRSLDAMMEGQEKERKRIAQDLHDRLGSMLSAIKLQFSALEGRIEELRADQKEHYQHVFGMLDDAVGEVRRISHDMIRSSLAQFGLKGALEDLRSALHAPGKLDVEMSLFGLEERMEQRIEIAAYRMVQECISNALKHAKADQVTIQVTRSAGMLNVIVEDNGIGFDQARVHEGMGLGNIRQRVAEVHGAVRFDSRPGRGTSVSIDIPLA